MNRFIVSFSDTKLSASLSDQSAQSFPTYQKLQRFLSQGIHDQIIQYQNSPGEYHNRTIQTKTLRTDMLNRPFDEINQYLIGCQIHELPE